MAYKITEAGKEIGVWDVDSLDLKDTFLIKAATGLDLRPIVVGFPEMDPAAWQAVVWWLRRTSEPGLLPEQVNFKWSDMDMDEVGEEVPPTLAESDGATTSADAGTTGSTSSAAG